MISRPENSRERSHLTSLLNLSEMSDQSMNKIMDFALNEAIYLTHSKIGYFFLYSEAEQLLTLHAWSREAMAQCDIEDDPKVFKLKTTGLWGEAIRQRKAIITNDYLSKNHLKKGYPTGHVPLFRHLNLPIFHDNDIVALIGVGNSEVDYDEHDIQQLQLFMNSAWNILEKKKAKQSLIASEEKFRTIAEFTYDWEIWLSPKQEILYCSPACFKVTGYTPDEIIQNPEIRLSMVYETDRKVTEDHRDYYHFGDGIHHSNEIEYRIITKDGSLKWLGHACQPVFSQQGEFLGRRISNRDITERKMGEMELVQSYEDIKKLNEHITHMLSIISHDIRSPLISMLASLRLLRRGRFGEMDQSALNTVDDLLVRAQKILGVADDYLGKSAALEGVINPQKRRIDLRQEVIDVVLEELSAEIDQANITIDNRLGAIPGGAIEVNASAMWLKFVYRNLFGNAIKYGGVNCVIAFGYENHDMFYQLNVYNSGQPIHSNRQSMLFTRFGQTRSNDLREETGVGMGLYLVKNIINQHGGEIWHKAMPEGNDFIFTLPKS